MANARVRRARDTEDVVADVLRHHGFPKAERVAASLPGKDILNTPELAIEVKATADFDINAAVRQARKNAGEDELPAVVHRPNGYGPERWADWPVVIGFREFIQLIADAGYGDFGDDPSHE